MCYVYLAHLVDDQKTQDSRRSSVCDRMVNDSANFITGITDELLVSCHICTVTVAIVLLGKLAFVLVQAPDGA